MNKINWKIRFTKKNKAFVTRVFVAVFIPILTYYGLKVNDITSWNVLFDLMAKAFSNPFILVMSIFNFINIIPDPTTSGFGDSEQALGYDTVKDDKDKEETETENEPKTGGD